MRLLGIDHVVIRARDPIAMERFYVEVLGCAVERRQDARTPSAWSSCGPEPS